MKTLDIATPLLKQRKILQVDYFKSQLIQTPRCDFQGWQQSIKLSKQQEKLLRYFQNQERHNQKYFRFKKLVNQKYFGKQLPQTYKNNTIAETIKDQEFMYSPSFMKMTSSLFQSAGHIDNSASDFITNFQSFKSANIPNKQTYRDKKGKSNLSRYWPLQDNISVILEEQEYPKRSKKSKDISIFSRTHGKSFRNSFTIETRRPMTQSVTRKSQRIKQLLKSTLNPQASKNMRSKINSLSEQRSINEKYKKKQQKSILDIISKQKLMKFLAQSRNIDPKRKGIFSLDDLTDIQKFEMSYVNYMKLKTKPKLDSYAYENKVKPKNDNLEKFQQFILSQFPIDNDSKRKLERIFQNIKYQFKMAERRKLIEKR